MKYSKTFLPAWLLVLAVLAPAFCQAAPEANSGPVRIALVSDMHVTRGTKESQPWHRVRFERAIEEVNTAHPDLILLGGDLTENGKPEEYRDFKQLVARFQAPVWYIPGNHDVGGKVLKGGKGAITWKRVKDFEMAMGPSWWVKELAGVRVVGANAPLMGSGLRDEKRMWSDLEEALAQPSKKPTLLLLHFPPFQKTNTEPGGAYWNLEPYPRGRLLGLAQQGGVKAILSGHLHKALTNQYDGITLLTTTTVAHGDPLKKQAFGWMLLTVSANTFRIEPQALHFEEPPYRGTLTNRTAAATGKKES
jgi:3',5'-cyclic AMP phosphodiesterase CpdA